MGDVNRSGRLTVIVIFVVAFAMLAAIGYFVLQRLSQSREAGTEQSLVYPLYSQWKGI